MLTIARSQSLLSLNCDNEISPQKEADRVMRLEQITIEEELRSQNSGVRINQSRD
ncbi:hypothetical protein [Dendronalium sp. ChiSLP03b]|uniref:hypothetical protein n=1 Tax=Dendronalium sp. ChiSLP03b TaxID=3075381 RepID=UPI002AD39765|nr:hypothetical protein [Dendronalium sp. ChiSLP03b]MDZ8207629.1 hypothetical protein [Dendronalium sp. ChiSLP03b]